MMAALSTDTSDNNGKLRQRWARIDKAINLEKPDRTPVILLYALFASKVTGRGFPEFCRSIHASAEIMAKAFDICGNADGMDYLGFTPYGLCSLWMSRVMVPGVDLPENVGYQVAEAELMKKEDYDTILDKGWPDFRDEFLRTRIYAGVNPEYLLSNQPPFDAQAVAEPMGIPVLTSGTPISCPFDLLCGGRSMTRFVHDMFTMPDKVSAVMDLMIDGLSRPVLDETRAGGYRGAWVGGWRCSSVMLSPRMWQKFVWPYLRRIILEVIEAGLTPILHLDSNWTRDLEFFREIPAGKCIMATDGATDLVRAKEILGDRFCLMGDVPSGMMAMGTPDKVYKYSTRLIRELGPEGFILHSGCDIPANAKLENVRAMIAAAQG